MKARKASRAGSIVLFAALIAAGLGAAYWFASRNHPTGSTAASPAADTQPAAQQPVADASPIAVAADHVDAANEGRAITISGALGTGKRVRDPQLGIEAAAMVLLREVDMLQWQEHCAASCEYALGWAPQPIDSHAFRTPQGHENPSSMPFEGARFVADDLRLGAFRIDPALAVSASEPIAWPVRAAQLPPNLAATFRERDGVLYAGDDAAHAAAGDLRVSFRIVAAGEQRLSGLQIADTLKPLPTRSR